ncbi:hypothetical protein IPN35_06105 [Candidatus Peregrinibacteria bacterium]|nr:MAG: hypothetical protein IPN35_06105 [Candidatus Peregrinibacteria bacterium]
MNEAEKRFQDDNGMTSQAAWECVLNWSKEKNFSAAKEGCHVLLQFFPERSEVKHFLDRLEKEEAEVMEKTAPSEGLNGQQNGHTESKKKGSFFEKIQTILPKQESLPGVEYPTENERLAATVSYLWILFVVPLFLSRESRFVQFHAWQGMVLTVGVHLFLIVFGGLFHAIGISILASLLYFLVFLVYIVGGVSAYTGKWNHLPLIFPLSERLQKIFSE